MGPHDPVRGNRLPVRRALVAIFGPDHRRGIAVGLSSHEIESGDLGGPEGRHRPGVSAELSPSGGHAPSTPTTIDATASKGARRGPSMWCRSARNSGAL